MKKYIMLALVIFLLFPLGFADGTEKTPEAIGIIGCWYLNMELGDEVTIPGYEDYTRFVQVLTFEEDGSITRFEIDYGVGSPQISGPAKVGRWEQISDNDYSLSILALGKEKAYILDGNLYAIAAAKDVYYCYHKMIPFDWYSDMYLK